VLHRLLYVAAAAGYVLFALWMLRLFVAWLAAWMQRGYNGTF